MELNKANKWPYYLVALWSMIVVLIGAWWAFLLTRIGTPSQMDILKLRNMLIWEGSAFFILMTLIGSTIVYLFVQNTRKNNSLHAFFASITHELKTPMASIKLQAQVISSMLDGMNPKVIELFNRLITDTNKLENEIDKSLQLSRVERDGKLNLVNIDLLRFLKSISKQYEQELKIEMNCHGENPYIMADEYALKIIIRNLIENTIRHNKQEKKVLTINIMNVELVDAH